MTTTKYKIYKYELERNNFQSLEIEGLVKVLNIVKQYNHAVMYVLVDTELVEFKKRMIVDVLTVGTGHELSTEDVHILTYDYINTLSFLNDEIMFHYFARKRDPTVGGIPA